ncbi:creatininase family protein [Deinococcus hopiensis]|uniref:Creatinine amidohydrolase n=1 Tax=Deinococcus hopiensis KR-140 TaxID=695939 RepID=A0A1W1V5H8_9DEIO|nr:creatininase family protein [Deinococcus hopiensis]SMB88553.1 creatinine amidohydrolase [Deinococcus hopiensis KR-140]
MQIEEMNWEGAEAYLRVDDCCVLPLGCTEQHATLSLATDTILAGRVAAAAAAPLGIPVFPTLPYGITPTFTAYPGTVSLRVGTYLALLDDLLTGLHAQGFRRILVVNGHGGNSLGQGWLGEWLARHPAARVQWHNWWNAPRTWAAVQAVDDLASHASWMENFPWTRLEGVTAPGERKPMVDLAQMRQLPPEGVRALLGDGNFAGLHVRPDEEMLAIWQEAVAETRELLERGWAE